jgi:hypothetical protein
MSVPADTPQWAGSASIRCNLTAERRSAQRPYECACQRFSFPRANYRVLIFAAIEI